jgi:hypothetical protein
MHIFTWRMAKKKSIFFHSFFGAQMAEARAAGANGKTSSQLVDSALRGSLGKSIDEQEVADADALSFTFVDEHTCVGCYNCAMVARNTFMMEGEHGRARVFQQKGDVDEVTN